METDIRDCRILAIALRKRWLGFTVLGNRSELMDWGMMFFQQDDPAQIKAATNRLRSLISRFEPSLIAVAISELLASRNAASVRSLFASLRREANTGLIPFRVVKREFVREAFPEVTGGSKDEVASALVKFFPEVRWKLPPKRRIWDREHFRMALFDALAVGVACWRHLRDSAVSNSTTK